MPRHLILALGLLLPALSLGPAARAQAPDEHATKPAAETQGHDAAAGKAHAGGGGHAAAEESTNILELKPPLAVATLIVYTNYILRNEDGSTRQESERHRVIVWGLHAEKAARLLRKGSKIRVQGRMTYPTWKDKQTGATRYGAEIVAQTGTPQRTVYRALERVKDWLRRQEADEGEA